MILLNFYHRSAIVLYNALHVIILATKNYTIIFLLVQTLYVELIS